MVAAGMWGSFPQWLIVFGLLLSAATFLRGNRSVAITNLRTERDELVREVRRLTVENTALRATRDLAPLQAAMLEAIEQHELRAQERAGKMLAALDKHLTLTELVARRLGPDDDA